MNLKKLIIVIIAFISFRCGDDIPDGVVDPVNENLHITSLNVPVDSVYNNPDKPLYISFRVNSPQNLKSAYFNLESPDGYEIFSKEALLDIKDTLTADDSTGDGIYSGRINLDSTDLNGAYKLGIFIENKAGEIIKAAANTFIYNNGKSNHIPVILDVTSPDTLVLKVEVTEFLLKVKVSDPDGLKDIAKVYFYVIKPDGTGAINKKLIDLFDGGSEGDEAAGDGIFTVKQFLYKTVPPEPPIQLGRYTFIYEVKDRSGAISDSITHYITITE